MVSKNSTFDLHRTYQALVSVADNVTGHVVKLMKINNMWENTIFVVSADNGSAPCMGSNYSQWSKNLKIFFFFFWGGGGGGGRRGHQLV